MRNITYANINSNSIAVGLFVVVIILKYFSINYGNPFLFHPDEPYIYKDPLKLAYNYAHFNFSSSTNLFYWIILIWFGIVFIWGLLIGQWTDFSQFKELLILEDFSIIFYGRMLSIALSSIGTYFFYKTICKITNSRKLQPILLATVLLNPIEIISDQWLKFDAAVYCFISIMIFLVYRYIELKEDGIKKKLIMLLFLGPAIRIDLIIPLIFFIFYEFKNNYNFKIKAYLKANYKYLVIGSIIYLIVTVKIFSPFFTKNSDSIETVKTFEQVLTTKILSNISNGDFSFIKTIKENAVYYLYSCLILIIPIPVFSLFILRHKSLLPKMLLIIALFSLFPMLIFPFHSPHYVLPISLYITIAFIIEITKQKKASIILATLHLIYIGSLTFSIFYFILSKKDTRIIGREYILKNTTQSDLLAIEGYVNLGQYPPIEECPDVLVERAKIVREKKTGTGESLIAKAKYVDKRNCRNIICVSYNQRYKGTKFEKVWNNYYDASSFNSISPKFFISKSDQSKLHSDFSIYISKNYTLKNKISISVSDFRLNNFFQNENYFPDVFIYEKNL